MPAVADQLPAFQIKAPAEGHTDGLAGQYLSLRATGDGWTLLTPAGQVVFSALGLAGRRRCLQYARAAGVLAVLS